ncbi:MAG: hypothetical protein HIU81_13740 [Acidobacteria bacterium]|nr:hypothetical protein [Acidobacteriota bacterium]
MKNLTQKLTHPNAAATWVYTIAINLIINSVLFSIHLPASGLLLFPLLILSPGIITMILVPGAWRRWYRWLGLLGLMITSYSDYLQITALILTTWATHASWVSERTAPIRWIHRRTKSA